MSDQQVQLERITSALESLAKSNEILADSAKFTGSIESYWLVYLTLAIAVAGVFFAWRQLGTIRKQIEEEGERHLRQQALNVLKDFNEGLQPEYEDLGTILSSLTESKINKIVRNEPVRIPQRVRPALIKALSKRLPSDKQGFGDPETGLMSKEQVAELNSVLGDCVNHIETALVSVYARVADRKLVLEQITPYLTGDLRKAFMPLWKAYGAKYLPKTMQYLEETKPVDPDLINRKNAQLEKIRSRQFRTPK